ncbi:retrotransposon protein, putative, ty1-copia subclass [Tanacetum coccineum]
MVRSMMSQTTLPKSFWDYALESVARILNMVPTKKETMGYSFYNPSESKIFVARNAEFFKSNLIDQEASRSLDDLEIIQEEDTNPSLDTSLNHEEDDQEIDEPQSDINPICRSTRTRRPTDRLCLYIDVEEHDLGNLGEPAYYKAALKDPEFEKWQAAMNVEIQSMKDNNVWDLVELPPNAKTVGHKWIFKKKTDMDGAVHTFKSRLVAKGFTQIYGVDHEETFSPITYIRAIRILISIAAFYVKTAFLNEHLSKEVYMTQPKGFVNPKYPNHVCKLKHSIYELKQASRQWNKRFDDEIKKFGFTQNQDEPCVYLKASRSYVTFLILYVDDILIMGNNIPMLQDVKSYLGKCFSMKDLGEAAYILGINRRRWQLLVNFEPDPRVHVILGRPFLRTAKALIDLYEETFTLSSSLVKTSDNFEKFADELAPLDSLPPGNDDSTLKKDLHEENFQVECFAQKTIIMSRCFPSYGSFFYFEEGYFDSEGDVIFLDNLLSNDASRNLASEVISDHEPEQNESLITFSSKECPFTMSSGEILTLPSRNDHEFGEYLSFMTVLCEILTSESQENVHANQSLVIESLPRISYPVEGCGR